MLTGLKFWKKYKEDLVKRRSYYKYLPEKILAFTLAEVLITLLIIGIIGSLVIPALIADTQQAELITAWKKEYSVVAQSFQRVLTDNAGTLKGVCPSVGWQADSECIMNTFQPYLNISKYCLETMSYKNTCWHSWDPPTIRDLAGNNVVFWSNSYPALILSDGALLSFQGGTSDCTTSGYSANNMCIFIVVDVNGFKKPNVLGKDIFLIHVFENKINPFGANDTYANDCNTNPPSGQGYGCSAKYLK